MTAILVRPLQAHERESAARLIADVFAKGDYSLRESIYNYWLNSLPLLASDKLANYRAAFDAQGQLLSLAHVTEAILHYGQAKIKVAGIAAVCTHPDYRQRGYSAAVLRDTLTYAAEQGAHMALLHGIRDYYDHFGFMPVWPKYIFQAPVEEALQLPMLLRLVEARTQHLPEMARLYQRHWGGRVTLSRKPDLWLWRLEKSYGSAVVALNEQNQVMGYLWHSDRLVARVEVLADTPEAVSTLLAFDARRWRQGEQATLQWAIPPDDVIIPYAQQLLPITVSAQYYHSGGWMARLVDSAALIQILLPEIRAQARFVWRDFDPKQLILQVHSDSVEIGLQNVPDSLCRLALRDFIQILFASLRPSTLALRQTLSPESIQLLELLFPPRIASIAAWDWF